MNILDITLDFETCALCPTAAVMSVGAVVWDRAAENSPFITCDGADDLSTQFYRHVDLRSSFTDGFTFDQDTANWWAKQSKEAKSALLEYDDMPLVSLEEVITDLCQWFSDMKDEFQSDEICLWSQGSDFDIAILRNICAKYGIKLPVKYTNFRDHRTFFLESARMLCDECGEAFSEKRAYAMVDEYEGAGQAHNPIFDCKRSIYSTWQMIHMRKAMQRIA